MHMVDCHINNLVFLVDGNCPLSYGAFVINASTYTGIFKKKIL